MAERAPPDLKVVGSNPASGSYVNMTISITRNDGYIVTINNHGIMD